MFERPYLQTVKNRIQEQRRFIQVIYGPRQVGKTTMINQLLSQITVPAQYESADAVSVINSTWLLQVWESDVKANNAGMNVFAARFQPEKILKVGTGGISYSDFLKVNPKELF